MQSEGEEEVWEKWEQTSWKLALYKIRELFDHLREDTNFGPVDLAIGLALIASVENNATLHVPHHRTPSFYRIFDEFRLSNYKESEKLLRRAKRYMQFASSVYGWKLLISYGHLKKMSKEIFKHNLSDVNKICLAFHCNIPDIDKCLIYARWTTQEVFFPGHFLVIDHSTASVVFAIRGTLHTSDILTDLVADYVPFLGGKAHGGFVRAAEKCYESTKKLIIDTLQNHVGYGLVICGHSLGAGTAILLSLLFKRDYPLLPLECFAYAPPPAVSLDLAVKCKPFVKSFVLGEDIVTRLSYGSLKDLLLLVGKVLATTESKTLSLIKPFFQDNNAMWKPLKQYTDAIPPISMEPLKDSEQHEKLYIAGTVFHIERLDSGKIRNYKFTEKNCLGFVSIVLNATSFAIHHPRAYEKAFHILAKDKIETITLKRRKTWFTWKTMVGILAFGLGCVYLRKMWSHRV